MASMKRFNKNISVQVGPHSKQLLKVGYLADGSYWIQDLIRPKGEAARCSVVKLAWHQKNHGMRTTKALYQAVTTGNLKLSHHLSGRAQISGEGVVSGYDEQGNPKGAAIVAFLLDESNDGGTTLGFMTWGVQHHPRDAKAGDIVLIPDVARIHSSVAGEPLNAIVVEGYYLLKKFLPKPPFSQDVVNYHNPIAGDCQLQIVQSPDASPGVLGFCASFTKTEATAKSGFTLSGAPGKIYGDYCDGISIIYPHEIESPLDVDLDWKG